MSQQLSPRNSSLDRPYHEYDPREMILRDHLALDRTVLANERTVLAYVRTAVGVAITGIMLIKLFAEPGDMFFENLGRGMLVLAAGIAVLGFARHRQVKRRLARIFQETGLSPQYDEANPSETYDVRHPK